MTVLVLGDISVFGTFKFEDISVLVTIMFCWHFSFSDISVLVPFHILDISVRVTFQCK